MLIQLYKIMTLYYYGINNDENIKKFEILGWKKCILTNKEKIIINNTELLYDNILLRVKIIINSILRISQKKIYNILLIGDGLITPINNKEYWKYDKNNKNTFSYEYNKKIRKNFSDLLKLSINIDNYALPCCSFNSFYSLFEVLRFIKLNNTYYDIIILVKCDLFDKIVDQHINKLKLLTNLALKCKHQIID